MKDLQIHLRTLTPLWTGGIDQTADRLHETGLIGSLRWWYEALVRGLGGYACDPTEHGCQFDEEKYHKSKASDERQRLLDAGVCDACQLFGCTGWARKFRLSVSLDGQKLFDDKQNILIPSGRVHQKRDGTSRAGGWFIFSESRLGEIAFKVTPLREVDLLPLYTILMLISRHASVGPKGASGYGVIQANVEPELDWIQAFDNQPPRNSALPDFRDFFFARFQFQEPSGNPNWWQNINGIQEAIRRQLNDGTSPKPLRQAKQKLKQMKQQGILPIAPAIRNWLRYHWQHGLSDKEAHFVFGEAQAVCPNCYKPGLRPDKHNRRNLFCPNCRQPFEKERAIPTTASKILVSYAYRVDSHWEFRIWGWLPCGGQLNNRDDFLLNKLKPVLQGKDIWKFVFGTSGIAPTVVEWHALTCDQTDGKAYLKKLLGGAQ